jgi:hypothetical protein
LEWWRSPWFRQSSLEVIRVPSIFRMSITLELFIARVLFSFLRGHQQTTDVFSVLASGWQISTSSQAPQLQIRPLLPFSCGSVDILAVQLRTI